MRLPWYLVFWKPAEGVEGHNQRWPFAVVALCYVMQDAKAIARGDADMFVLEVRTTAWVFQNEDGTPRRYSEEQLKGKGRFV